MVSNKRRLSGGVGRLVLVVLTALGTAYCTEPDTVVDPPVGEPEPGQLTVSLTAGPSTGVAYKIRILGDGIESVSSAGATGTVYFEATATGVDALYFGAASHVELLRIAVGDTSGEFAVSILEVAGQDNQLLDPSRFSAIIQK